MVCPKCGSRLKARSSDKTRYVFEPGVPDERQVMVRY